MTLDLSAVGKKSEPFEYEYTWKDVVLYALGIGASNEDLDFVYEKDLKVYPTFAVIPPFEATAWTFAKTGADLAAILHAGQKIVIHGEIPVESKLTTTARISDIYDKKKFALIVAKAETRDETGAHLFDNIMSIIIRGEGGFGGERGPKAENEPPEAKEPDFHDEIVTSENQNLIYRLSGDLNPLHIDPEFAELAGFDRPILHGLCTFGVAGRSVLKEICENDPSRLKSYEGRFRGIVYPGDTIITEGWEVSDKEYVVQSKNQRNEIVLSNGRVELK